MPETAPFYGELLKLQERVGPPPLKPKRVRWMFAANGIAVLHLNSGDCPPAYDREVVQGGTTGAIPHIALRCGAFDTVKARLDKRGADDTVNDVPAAGLKQILTADPTMCCWSRTFLRLGRRRGDQCEPSGPVSPDTNADGDHQCE